MSGMEEMPDVERGATPDPRSCGPALGLLLSAAIRPADVQDRDGAIPLLRAARRLFPFVEVILADGAYRGETTAKAVAGTGRRRLEIVSRGAAEGFVPLAKRWSV